MAEKSTGDLVRELMADSDLDAYLRENCDHFESRTLTELLAGLYEKKSLSKAALAREAGMSEVYLHQVFSGRRRPSRDRLLCLCVGLGATLEECQQLLKQAGYAPLYPKNRRDVIISFCLLHDYSLHQINDKLFDENEQSLS